MKSVRFIAAILAILLAVSLIGCGGGTSGSKEGGTITFNLDGAPVDCSRSSCGGYYMRYTSGIKSVVSGYGGDDPRALKPYVSIHFPGTSPGTFSSPNGGGAVHWTPATENVGYWAIDEEEGTSYTINVTKYGAVGELIEGTFSATIRNGYTTTITNGYFSVIRKEK